MTNNKTQAFTDSPMGSWSQSTRRICETAKNKEWSEKRLNGTFLSLLIDMVGDATMDGTPAEMIIINEPIPLRAEYLNQLTDWLCPEEREDLDNLFPNEEINWKKIESLVNAAMVELTKEHEDDCLSELAYVERQENDSFKDFKKQWSFTKKSESEDTFKLFFDSEMYRLKHRIRNEQKRIKYLESLLDESELKLNNNE